MEKDLIKISNPFLEGIYKGKLKALDKKILNLISLKSQADRNENNVEYVLLLKEIKEVHSLDDYYPELLQSSKRLCGLVLELGNDKDYFKVLVPVTKAEYKKGELSLRVEPDFKKILLQLDKGFTQYLLSNIRPLRSIYSIRIYELLKRNSNEDFKRELKYSVEDWKKILGCEGKFNHYGDFKRTVFLKAQKDLDEHCDRSFHLIEQKAWRKVKELTLIPRMKDYEIIEHQPDLPEMPVSTRKEKLELEIRSYGWIGDWDKFFKKNGGFEAVENYWFKLLKASVIVEAPKNTGGFITDRMKGAKRLWDLEKRQVAKESIPADSKCPLSEIERKAVDEFCDLSVAKRKKIIKNKLPELDEFFRDLFADGKREVQLMENPKCLSDQDKANWILPFLDY